MASERNSEGQHRPVIEYQTRSGKTQQFSARIASYPQAYFVGDKVEVVDRNGARRMLNNVFRVYGFAIIAAVFSAIAFISAIAIYFIRVRWRLV